jgi:phage terminase large subunit GpA-like protein
MLRDVKVMREVFPKGRGHDKRDTLSGKIFLGSRLYTKGGKAARSYRRISVDYAILDELDGFDHDIEKEGSPDKLAGKRVEGAVFPKEVMGSTPKLKGFSRIEARGASCGSASMCLVRRAASTTRSNGAARINGTASNGSTETRKR